MLKFARTIEAYWNKRAGVEPSEYSPMDPLPEISIEGDLFSILHDEPFAELFSKYRRAAGFQTVSAWICSFESSSRGALYTPHKVAAMEDVTFLLFLDEIRRRCVSDIEEQLKVAAIRQEIPRMGVCLVFPDDLSFSYLADYAMRADQMHVHFVDCLPAPKALLRIEDIVNLKKAQSKNLAKSFIQSGHKTIVHGGVLTHVDRRLHPQVFGPSIDTLLMASIVGCYMREKRPTSVLEIGVGSGHIYSTAAVYAQDEIELCGVDVEPGAVLCCATNMRRHEDVFGLSLNSNLIIGKFDPKAFARKFDLIVSNPPYIPRKEVRRLRGRQLHSVATTGTELLQQILESLPRLLSPGGEALIMTSSTTPEPNQWLAPELECEECLKTTNLTAPFDVDFTLDNPQIIEQLIKAGGLSGSGDSYEHVLRPIWVRRRP